MAARLMMHYPGVITCDTETFQCCRLSAPFFKSLATKVMKGLRNVGIIRQFVGFAREEKLTAEPITHSEYPMLGLYLG